MNFTNSNMIARTLCILRTATCRSKNKNVSAILQNNINFVIISRSKTTRNIFEPTQKMYRRKLEQNKKFGISQFLLLGIPVLTFGLGTWQIARLFEKLELIEKLTNRTAQKPIELPENLDELKSKEYYPVKVKGEFLHEKEFLVGPRTFISNQTKGQSGFGETDVGFLVITPFKVKDKNLTILINRGWVPKAEMHPSKRKAGQVEGTVELVGLVKFGEKRPPLFPKNETNKNIWVYKNIDAMAEMVGAAPYCLDAVVETTVPDGPIGGQTKVNLRNDHLSYIFTWYGITICTMYMWYKRNKVPRF